ncbi:lipopolysaccharide biosynthesis protein [Bradyrhizobium sp. DASA03076]|uniref:lipopolysaccharide biosynthesis protein n=1 Tax=Bradyrhizobium sp. BLXBL-03 TaxID=3395916 RepID=UPI003F6F299C
MAKLIYSLFTTALVQVANLGFGIAAARLLGPTDRGVLAYQVTLSAVIATLFSFGIGEAIAYKATAKSGAFPHSTYVVSSVVYGIAGTLAWLAVYPLVTSISNNDQYVAYLIFAVYPALNYITVSFVAWFAGAGQTRAWNIQRLLVQLAQPLTLACFILIEGPSISSFAFSIVAAHVLAVGVGVYQISIPSFLKRPRWVDMKEVFQLGAQSFGTRLSNLIRDNADRLIVGTFAASNILAQYVVAVSFAQIFNAYSQTIIQLYFSRIGATLNSEKKADIERESAFLIFGGGIAATLVSVWAGKWLVTMIFGDKFAMAGELAPVLVGGMVFSSMKALIAAHALAMGRPWLASKIDVYAVVPTIALMLFSVRFGGAFGAAYAFAASQAITACATILAYRTYRKRVGVSQASLTC